MDTIIGRIRVEIDANKELQGLAIAMVQKGSGIFLKGEVPSDVHRSLIIQIARNKAGDIPLDDSGLIAVEVKDTEEKKEFLYTVKRGDSLGRIAYNFYGNANLWETICKTNRDKIIGPELIYEGQVLRIPF